MLATPCFGGQVSQLYMTSVLALMQHAPRAGYGVALALLGYDSLISRARSTLLAQFLDNPAATHLLFVDADIGFAADQVDRLLQAGVEFAGALYPLKRLDWERMPERCVSGGETPRQAALSYVGSFCEGAALRWRGAFATARYAGGGFQLIRRTAVERMIAAYPETRFQRVHGFPAASEPRPNLYALFDCMIDAADGAYLSEDYAFCARWRAIGGDIWLDTQSRLTHVGCYDYAGDHATRGWVFSG